MRPFQGLVMLTLLAGCFSAACSRGPSPSQPGPLVVAPGPTSLADAGAHTAIAETAPVPTVTDAGAMADISATDRDASVAAADTGAAHDARDTDAVREAAFRYMFKHNASGAQQSVGTFCIGLGEKDPPAAFVARFRNERPVVKAQSACDAGTNNGVTDKSTGKRGLLFHVEDKIRWVDADHAELDGGYYEAGLSASGNTYFAERKNGHWVVVRDVMHWIS